MAVLVLSALAWYLGSTSSGRLIRAVADDREAAQLSGVRYRHVFGIATGWRRPWPSPMHGLPG